MNNTDLIKELRVLTSAGMKDCKEALVEANWDLQAAVDIIKIKGLNIASGREGRVAAEGRVATCYWKTEKCMMMCEVNCETDFVAASSDFDNFVQSVLGSMCVQHDTTIPFDPSFPYTEAKRQTLVAKTKENIIVRRWWVEEVFDDTCRTFSYVHPNPQNGKIGVVISLQASTKKIVDSVELAHFADNLGMQVAAMNPLAVSIDRLPPEEVEPQRTIFETQLKELNKPEASWLKIMEGKFRKWHSEVCLLEQEAVWLPKTTIRQAIQNVSATLGEIQIMNFIRCQVGEGIEVKKDNLAEEVAKLM